MQFRDYYATLEVPKTATADEIKKAYRRLSKKYHPDVNVGSKSAEDKFKELGEAYEVLKDPEKRRRYDRLGADWKTGPSPGGGGASPYAGWQNVQWNTDFGGGGGGGFGGGAQPPSGFSDFFDAFFSGQDGPQRGRQRRRGRDPYQPQVRRGADREAELEISLEDALAGVTRTITLQHTVTGADGGRRVEEKSSNVKVPAQAREGMKIRLKGEGDVGLGGAENGDLFLVVRLKAHARFVVDGADLTARLPITPWEAALGAKVPFSTLEGEVKLTVPPNSSSGAKLRLKGKGLAKKDGERGNITVELMVAMPTDLKDDERELMERWAKLRPTFDPRS